jgi:hypothetical protein
MDWIMIFYLLTESPNAENVQSHSHTLVNFTSEKLCTDALRYLSRDTN